MEPIEVVLLVVVLLAVAAAIALAVAQRNRRRAQLKSTFGSEYDRTVERTGGRRDAERELAERAERRRALDIRPLPETARLAYAERWRTTQADFVDRPGEAVRSADRLVTEVMAKRGYPVEDVDQMARDVSVDHADTVEEYRSAQAISQLNDLNQASTEQLRQAMVHYRALFDDLLTDSPREPSSTGGGPVSGERDGASNARHDDEPRHDEPRHDEPRHDDRVPDDVGASSAAGRRPDERTGRDRVEVVRVERESVRDGSADGLDVDRSGTTRVEQGGLVGREEQRGDDSARAVEHRDGPVSDEPAPDGPSQDEQQSGLGRGGFEPDSLVRGRADDGLDGARADRPRDGHPST